MNEERAEQIEQAKRRAVLATACPRCGAGPCSVGGAGKLLMRRPHMARVIATIEAQAKSRHPAGIRS